MVLKLDKNGQPELNISDRVLPEQETRRKVLNRCKQLGCYNEAIAIFNKYDKLLYKCTNQKERDDIAKLGIYEMYVLMEKGGKLYVKNELIYTDPDDPSNQSDNKIII